jgi:DNA-binding CsgD family transcriptional regulator
LTASEARLALCIADGLDIAEIAAAHKIAESTARSQLKAVFAKTGTRRQAELGVLLARFRLL